MAYVKAYQDLASAIDYYCDPENEDILTPNDIEVKNVLRSAWDEVKGNWKVGKKHGKERLREEASMLVEKIRDIPPEQFVNLSEHDTRFQNLMNKFYMHVPEFFNQWPPKTTMKESATNFDDKAQIIEEIKNLEKQGILTQTTGSNFIEKVKGLVSGSSQNAASSSDADDDKNCSATKPIVPRHITFNDVIGQESTKSQLLVNYVYPFKYAKLFPRKSKGILLYGPPGTGKSFMAKAATNQVDRAAFFAPAPADLKGKHHGDTEKAIRRYFHCAAEAVRIAREDVKGKNKLPKYNTAIIFIDEADSIIGLRTISEMMALSTNAFLQAMDGIESSPDVSVIAATNYPWKIDDAAARRFGEKILIDKPNKEDIRQLVENEIKNIYPPIREKGLRLFDPNTIQGVIAHMLHRSPAEACKKPNRHLVTAAAGVFKAEVGHYNVTHEFLDYVADQMSESNDMATLVTKMKNGEVVDISVARDDPKKYFAGYSPSDISNIMSNAAKTASLRSMKGFFRKVELTTGTDQTDYVYVSCDYDIIQALPGGQDTTIYYIKEIVDAKTYKLNAKGFSPIPDTDFGKCMNFTLCPQDILEAIKNYPPTINPYKYLQIIRFAHLNITPEEAGEDD
jgi:SpoVK/Ycf46/Vps4 family AAA+-type ATPase